MKSARLKGGGLNPSYGNQGGIHDVNVQPVIAQPAGEAPLDTLGLQSPTERLGNPARQANRTRPQQPYNPIDGGLPVPLVLPLAAIQ